MSYGEAIVWLKGEGSTINTIPDHPLETWQVRIYQANAALRDFYPMKTNKQLNQ
ncbi:MAG: hypothetical protein ACFE95_09785 [Candidatus Hodarchaeota archaeon]